MEFISGFKGLIFILVLSTHLGLKHPKGIRATDFPTKILCAYICLLCAPLQQFACVSFV